MATLRFVLAAVFLSAASAAALADPIYSANLTNLPSGVSNSPTPVVLQSSQSLANGASGSGIIVSDRYLAGSVSSAAIAANVFQSTITYNANASSSYDDIFIVGAPGTIATTLHVPFDAVFTQNWASVGLSFGSDISTVIQDVNLSATLISPGNGISSARIEVRGIIDSQQAAPIQITPQGGGGTVQAHPGNAPETIETHGFTTIIRNHPLGDVPGYLSFTRVQTPITVPNTGAGVGAGFLFDDTVVFHGEILLPIQVTIGTPLTLVLTMSLGTTSSGSFALGSFGSIDALHTFGVPQNGSPVFDLPAGYTAQSRSLNIVNNAVPGAAGAPLPGSLVLLASALVPAVALRRRFAALFRR